MNISIVIFCHIVYNDIGDSMKDLEKTEMLNLTNISKKEKKDLKLMFFRTIPLLLIPMLFVLTIISVHSKRLLP